MSCYVLHVLLVIDWYLLNMFCVDLNIWMHIHYSDIRYICCDCIAYVLEKENHMHFDELILCGKSACPKSTPLLIMSIKTKDFAQIFKYSAMWDFTLKRIAICADVSKSIVCAMHSTLLVVLFEIFLCLWTVTTIFLKVS